MPLPAAHRFGVAATIAAIVWYVAVAVEARKAFGPSNPPSGVAFAGHSKATLRAVDKLRTRSRVPLTWSRAELDAIRDGTDLLRVINSESRAGRKRLKRCEHSHSMNVKCKRKRRRKSASAPAVIQPLPPFTDGCDTLGERMLDSPGLVHRMRACCNERMICYASTADTTVHALTKTECDNYFYFCMRMECSSLPATELTCRAYAYLYFKAVAATHCALWKRTQRRARCPQPPLSALTTPPRASARRVKPSKLQVLTRKAVTKQNDAELQSQYFGVRAKKRRKRKRKRTANSPQSAEQSVPPSPPVHAHDEL